MYVYECVCEWDLTWIRSKDCCVPMLPCIINHLQRCIDSLLLQSWRSRACSHTAVSHTQWLSPIFSLLYYYSWYSGPNEVEENGERKKSNSQRPNTQTHSHRCSYISVRRLDIRDFFTCWGRDAASLEHGGWSICLAFCLSIHLSCQIAVYWWKSL